MEHLEKEMAELQAALAGHGGDKSHEDSSDGKNDEEVEEKDGEEVAALEPRSPSPPPSLSPRSLRKASKASAESSSFRKIPRSQEGSSHFENGGEECVFESDEEEEKAMEEPRSPSPPPSLSPRSLRKASKASVLSTSIHKVTRLVEQYRSTSSKKGASRKQRVERNDDRVSSDEDADCSVSSGIWLEKSSSAKKNGKKRMMIRGGESDSEDGVSPAGRSRSNSQGKRIKLSEADTSSKATPKSRTTLISRNQRNCDSSHEQLSSSNGADVQPQPRTPNGRFDRTPRGQIQIGGTSSAPSPVDVSMKTQQSSNERPSPGLMPPGESKDSTRV